MTPDIGRYALALAMIVFISQAALGVMAIRNALWLSYARRSALSAAVLLGGAFLVLVAGFIQSDFSLQVVAANSHIDKPFAYKIAGAWGNHEGSMLLWCLVLAAFGAGLANAKSLSEDTRARALAVMGALAAAFVGFALFTSSPFTRLDPAPFDGAGLNPLLQDPALAAHPPMLYLGYVGLSAPFALAIAGLWSGRADREWARAVRQWTLIAFVPLTLGIALGAYWAYYELGWGGWWFWDPVENSSLMPWLCATALLHSALVTERRGAFPGWTALLAIVAFGFSLVGAFLTRSGILTSVHAFAVSPQRGAVLLAILGVALGGAFALFALRAGRLRGDIDDFDPVSRESALLANNVVFLSATVVVFLGTMFPLLAETFGGVKASVGPPYFEGAVLPILGIGLFAAPVAMALAWGQGHLARAFSRLRVAAVLSLATSAAILWLSQASAIGPAAAGGLAVWLVAASATDLVNRANLSVRRPDKWIRVAALPRRALAAAIAHAGIGMLTLGAAADAAFPIETHAVLAEGEAVEVMGRRFELRGISQVDGPNYVAERAEIVMARNGRTLDVLLPERRFFPAGEDTTSEVSIRSSPLGDLYVALGPPVSQGDTGFSWSVRVTYNPLIWMVFFGAVVTALGGGFALFDVLRASPRSEAAP